MTISDTPNGQKSSIPGWGVDSRPEDRPGVPVEFSPPHPIGNAHWIVPDAQRSNAPPAALDRARKVTPVYSSQHPPRGLSGVIRRAAYQVPPYKPQRWMMLLFADRIDVLEHNVKPLAKLAAGAALVWVGFAAVRALRRA